MFSVLNLLILRLDVDSVEGLAYFVSVNPAYHLMNPDNFPIICDNLFIQSLIVKQ